MGGKSGFTNVRSFNDGVDQFLQQAGIPQQTVPQEQYQESVVEDVSDGFLGWVEGSVPSWFLASSFIVGAITIAILAIKFSPLKGYVGSLFRMWGNLLKGK